MRFINFSNPHRRKHFDFFRNMSQPHFSLVANVDISDFLVYTKTQQLAFTPHLVYLLSRAANGLPAFRWRIRGDDVVEHESVHPSFTVPTEASDVFSFCTVDYHPEATVFVERANATIERMKSKPNLEDEPGRDDYLFLSAIPWVSFTGITHAMHYDPVDSVPRITWGKYFQQDDRTLMPLGVQAHHAVVDGRDMGRYFVAVQELLAEVGVVFAERA